MDSQSWRLFLETGDPLCYLFCRVERDPQAEKTEEDAPTAAEQKDGVTYHVQDHESAGAARGEV